MKNWSEQQLAIVDKAILGRATEAELKQLDRWINDSLEFNREYEAYKEIHQSLSDQGLQEFMDEFQVQHQSQSSDINTIKSLNWYWIAASIALLIAIGWWLVPQTNLQDLQSKYAMKNDQIHLTTASTDTKDRLMAKTESAYNGGRFEEALILVDSLQSMDKQNLRWTLYKGMTLYQMDQFDQAKTSFTSLMNEPNALLELREESVYWVAITHLAQGDVELALGVLEEWSEISSNPLSQKSKELLDDLKKIN